MANTANVTTLNKFKNNAAKLLNNNFNVNELRTNDLLRKDEWEDIDDAVLRVARQRLNAFADIQNAGLTRSLGGLGTLIDIQEKMSEMTDAEVDMSGETEGEGDRQQFTPVATPIPIIHKDFSFNTRMLQASRDRGDSLDTTGVESATRQVTEAIETMMFSGASVQVDGNTINGYTNHSDINTSTAEGDWGTTSNIYPTVTAMIGDAEAAGYYGPYTLYCASQQWAETRAADAEGSGDLGTARDRIMDLDEIENFKPTMALDDGELVLVQLTRDVIEVSVAQDIIPVEWESGDGMVLYFKVMAALAPKPKSDYNGNSGIVYYTGA